MGFTYAIGDLHGRDDVLGECIKRIEQDRLARGDETGEKTTIVFLGDYIDRGKNSRAVIERLMAGAEDSAKWVILMGNHELMALMAHADPKMYWAWWCDNGGLATAMNYDHVEVSPELQVWAQLKLSPLLRPQFGRSVTLEHLQWMNELPTRFHDKHRLFVHAGVKKDIPLHLQTDEMVLWVRHKRDEEVQLPIEKLEHTLYTVHGHTPFMDGPVVLESRCNLDTQSYRTGKAAIAVFDDEVAGKPIAMITASAGYDVDPQDWKTW
jgi:serine/threonine protein phosphatase 1